MGGLSWYAAPTIWMVPRRLCPPVVVTTTVPSPPRGTQLPVRPLPTVAGSSHATLQPAETLKKATAAKEAPRPIQPSPRRPRHTPQRTPRLSTTRPPRLCMRCVLTSSTAPHRKSSTCILVTALSCATPSCSAEHDPLSDVNLQEVSRFSYTQPPLKLPLAPIPTSLRCAPAAQPA